MTTSANRSANFADMSSNLQRLSAIRALVLAGQCSALFYFSALRPLGLPTVELALLLALFALITVQGWWRQRCSAISSREFFTHLMVDCTLFTLLLYFSGGASNPFISYYLIPITIAAITLSGRLTAAITLFALVSYTVLLELYVPIEALSMSAHSGHASHRAEGGANLHIIGMWVNFALSASIIGYYISRMATTVRVQQQLLEQQRADQLRSDQLNAIGLLAAGTAHELGTPLNTMRIVLDELREPATDTTAEDIQLLSQQVGHCQTILRSLVETARQATDPSPHPVTVASHLHKLVERWQLLRPGISVSSQFAVAKTLQARLHPAIDQAIINLLNNAADASPELVSITATDADQQLSIAVQDRGPGLVAEAAENDHGLGIGLTLTQATVERFGGQLQLTSLAEGGSLALLTLPLAAGEPA